MKLYGTFGETVFKDNPGIELLDISQNLIQSYGEKRASKYFWALYLVYHPESSIFDLATDQKKDKVMAQYLVNEKKSYDQLLGPYIRQFIEEYVNDPIAKMLSLIKIKFDEYAKEVFYLDFRVEISEDKNLLKQANDLQDLQKYDKEIEKFENILKKYDKRKDTGILYKGVKESIRERRMRLGRNS